MSLPDLIRSRDRKQAGPTAPAQGLCLLKVRYGFRKDYAAIRAAQIEAEAVANTSDAVANAKPDEDIDVDTQGHRYKNSDVRGTVDRSPNTRYFTHTGCRKDPIK